MNDRLQTFLTLENLTAAQLADILGIQRSGLSHILSGRNNPGYDFIVKFIKKFPRINTDWLLTGNGKPYKEEEQQNISPINNKVEQIEKDLFSDENIDTNKNHTQPTNNKEIISTEKPSEADKNPIIDHVPPTIQSKRRASRVIIFYDDNSFEELFPNK